MNRFDVQLDSRLALRIAGHKPISYRLLAELGAPVVSHHAYSLPDAGRAWEWAEARVAAGRGVVVKPALGSAGRGVTTGVRTRGALRRASSRAAAVSARLLVEEELEGDSFRLLYLDGELLDAIVRRRPTVVGDGRSSIGALVAAESAARLSGTIRALHPLTVDAEMRGFLRASGRDLASVPESGVRVDVKRVVNQNASRENESIPGVPHASTVELGRRLVTQLGLELASVDLLTTDVSRPLAETGGVVNEVNTTPGLHHHYLVANPGRDPARAVLERLLSRRGGRP